MNKDFEDLKQIEELVDRIDFLRDKKELSMYQLALKSGLSINTIKYLYRKKSFPNVGTLYKICEALEIPVWMLFKTNGIEYLSIQEFILINNYGELSETDKKVMVYLSDKLK